ncbi:phosphoenolpyruvate carboxylase [Shigella flexneri]
MDFAWTQNRLMLPARLGAGAALQKVVEDQAEPTGNHVPRSPALFSNPCWGCWRWSSRKPDLWLADITISVW